jgi:hypothetical protein
MEHQKIVKESIWINGFLNKLEGSTTHINFMLFHDQQSTCEQSKQSTTAHQLDSPLHHWLEYLTAYPTLDSSDKLTYHHTLAPTHHRYHHHEQPHWSYHQEDPRFQRQGLCSMHDQSS